MAAPALQPMVKYQETLRPAPRRRSRKAIRRARTLSILFLLVVAALVLLFPRVVHTQARSEMTGSTYTVEAGDTLWEIAASHAGQKDVRQVIYQIQKANELKSAEIQPGQVLFIPAVPGSTGTGR